jgi:tetratricopeptide (TPR) repeat protein
MRLRVVCFTLLLTAGFPLAVSASGNQAQLFPQAQPQLPTAPMTSQAERTVLHDGSDWALIAPHLPDPQTASAASLETAADILVARRFPEDALDYYGYALARGGSVSELLNRMGVVRLELRQYELAREMFLRTVRVQKKDAAAWNNLGVAEYEEKHYRVAVSAYSRASRLDSRSAVYHSNLGMAYFELKDMEAAQRQFAIALRIDPGIMDPKEGYGAVARVIGSANYNELCFQMAKMFALQQHAVEMRRWLAKASEGGFDVRNGMLADAAFTPYLKDPEVKQILANAELLRKKSIASASLPSLGNAPQP